MAKPIAPASSKAHVPQKLLTDFIWDILSSMYFVLPVKIVTIDHSTMTATVQPLLKKYVTDQRAVVDFPVVLNVPIAPAYYTAEVVCYVPPQPRDVMLAVVSTRSLDKILGDGEPQHPGSAAVHELKDAILIGGMRTWDGTKLPKEAQKALAYFGVVKGRKRSGGKSKDETTKYHLLFNKDGSVEILAKKVYLTTKAKGAAMRVAKWSGDHIVKCVNVYAKE